MTSHSEIKYSTFKNTATADSGVKFISDFISVYYIRLFVDECLLDFVHFLTSLRSHLLIQMKHLISDMVLEKYAKNTVLILL